MYDDSTIFPHAVNNLSTVLAADYVYGGDQPLVIRAEDSARFAALGLSLDRGLKLTVIHPDALDADSRLIDASRTTVYVVFFFDAATHALLQPIPANRKDGTIMAGDEATTGQDFPSGSLIRCEPTAGTINSLGVAVNSLETNGVATATAARFGPNGEYLPPEVNDFDAAPGSIHLGPRYRNTPDVEPKLVRSDANGTATTLA